MPEKRFFHRFMVPLSFVMLPLVLSFIVYFNSRRITDDGLHQFVAVASGLILIGCIFFGAIAIYPVAFFRGAKPAERIIAGLIPAIAFDLYEVYVVSGVFTTAESLYYALNPTSITIFLLAFGFMGICEIVCRFVLKRRGVHVRVFTPAPIISIVALIIGIYVTLIWGNGAHFFYLYVNGYLALFSI